MSRERRPVTWSLLSLPWAGHLSPGLAGFVPPPSAAPSLLAWPPPGSLGPSLCGLGHLLDLAFLHLPAKRLPLELGLWRRCSAHVAVTGRRPTVPMTLPFGGSSCSRPHGRRHFCGPLTLPCWDPAPRAALCPRVSQQTERSQFAGSDTLTPPPRSARARPL